MSNKKYITPFEKLVQEVPEIIECPVHQKSLTVHKHESGLYYFAICTCPNPNNKWMNKEVWKFFPL